jgi:FkbM family methyltransferase
MQTRTAELARSMSEAAWASVTGVLGGRPFSFVLKELVAPRNYAALARMARVCERPLDVARRYLLGGGDYPFACGVRTPVGVMRPTLYTHHDVWTFSEIFCREDYRAGPETKVVVDIGSNIGLSGLYFLTRNANCRCYLFEPDPRNVERLRDNLSVLDGRWSVEEVAVGPTAGIVSFGREPTGRYGAVGASRPDTIQVNCLSIDDVLVDVLAREGAIDVLKIDTEGLEAETVSAIRPELLERIDIVYFESHRPMRLHEDLFAFSFANETVTLRRQSPDGGPNTAPIRSRHHATPDDGSD